MKKILVAIMLVLVLSLSGCNLVDETLVERNQDRDIMVSSSVSGVSYNRSLENHDWVEVDTEDTHRAYKCVDIISITVYNSGVLEIIDDDYDVYVIHSDWQMEFYDYYAVADNG